MATWVELNLVATLDNLNDGFEPRILIGAPGKVAQALIVQVVVTDDADKSTQRNADASAHGTVGLAALGGVLGLFEVLQRGGADRLLQQRNRSPPVRDDTPTSRQRSQADSRRPPTTTVGHGIRVDTGPTGR